MKKIPTIFLRDFANDGKITREWHPDCLRIRDGEGIATYKWDGTAVMFRGGAYFKRYDAKRGKTPPDGFEPCGEPDEKTGHHPGWIPVDPAAPENRWHMEALEHTQALLGALVEAPNDGTYELIGPRIQANRHAVSIHSFRRHGVTTIDNFPRYYDEMEHYFTGHAPMEGVVFWLDGQPVAKIKSSDFGLVWK